MCFSGQKELAVNKNGRFSIPADTREILETLYGDLRLKLVPVISPSPHSKYSYIAAFPYSKWCERFQNFPSRTHEDRMKKRSFSTDSIDVKIDELGRVLAPQSLRDYLGFSCVVVGMDSYFEIWSRAEFAREEAERKAGEGALYNLFE